MSCLSFEETLDLWAFSLRDVKSRMRELFTQERVAASAGHFLDGLLGNERRKTGWMRAEAAGDKGPWRQQAILGRVPWDADALRDYALETLADPDAVLVIDETGFLKQGHASCGGTRQYTGSAGKIINCQIGVFAAYVSRHGHAFIDRALYLPKAWVIGRTKGGMNTKLHAICDSQGRPIDLFVTAGQVSDYIGVRALLSSLPKVDWLLGDRGYDADWFRDALKDKGISALHPRPKATQDTGQIRQAPIQTPQPHRDHVRQVQGLVARGNPL